MDRETRWVTVLGVTESDTTERLMYKTTQKKKKEKGYEKNSEEIIVENFPNME